MPTYKRRAKGLVKSGRARWSDDNETEICLLASPAQIFEEDNTMDIYDNDGNIIVDANLPEAPTLPETPTTGEIKNPELTIGYILGQMERIRADSKYIYEALKQISQIKTHEPSLNAHDIGSQAKAEAIGTIVNSREMTNQKLLDMYSKMYDDMKPSNASGAAKDKDKAKILELMAEMSENDEEIGHVFANYIGQYFKEVFR